MSRSIQIACCLLPIACCLLGCQQQMAEQPSLRPLDANDFFTDGREARPLLPGVIARGKLRDDAALYTGRVSGQQPPAQARAAGLAVSVLQNPITAAALLPSVSRDMALAEYTAKFPVPVTPELLTRGQERFNIYCAVCHDPTGNGRGKIVERGYTRPPSYITDRSRGFERRGISILLRDAPVGYYFEVISKGFGAMPDYATQVPPQDRWAIIAYIRALQLSQNANVKELPEPDRNELEKEDK